MILAFVDPRSSIAAESLQLPTLKTAGIIPLSVEAAGGYDSGTQEMIGEIEGVFPAVVKDSSRFRLINDEVVRELWKSEAGRKELVDIHELDAFVGLTAAIEDDVVSFTARIMDRNLKVWVQEEARYPLEEFVQESAKKRKEKLEDLIFALFNRIPVDVSVTSVLGQFITISGGQSQGVSIGDIVELERVKIASIHPANGSWISFNSRHLGKAKVIDVHSYNAVARLTELTHENSVEVGDGAKIPGIRSRVRFARLAENSQFQHLNNHDEIIVPPLYVGGEKKNPPSAILTEKTPKVLKAEVIPHREAVSESEPSAIEPEALAPKEEVSEEKFTASSSPEEMKGEKQNKEPFWESLKDPQGKWIDSVTGAFGPYWWSTRGPVNSSSRFPIWLLNHASLEVTRTLFPHLKSSFSGGAFFGQTTKGQFTGYDGNARIYWEDAIDEGNIGLFQKWRAGAHIGLNGLAVTKDRYGGGDWLRGGIFGGLGGFYRVGEDQQHQFEWFGDFSLTPLNIGRFGYAGKQHLIESAFATRLVLGVLQAAVPQEMIQWGMSLDYADERLTLKNSRRPHNNDYRLQVLARYRF